MKKILIFFSLIVVCLLSMAQNYPSEWKKYTSDAYYHDIESADTKQAALDRANSNLARQIQVRVSEVSKMGKKALNGQSSVYYESNKTLSTNVDMNLAESKSHYDDATGKHYVIVYINKSEACSFYEKEINMLIQNIDNAIAIADNYISTGFKQKARPELQKALQLFDNAAKPFFWLNVFGLEEYRLQRYLSVIHEKERIVKQRLADLEYGTTYCVVCDADLFGQRYPKLANEVKGELSAQGCNFVDDAASADYVIRINASAREYNTFNGAYFIYVDAKVSVDKTATSQRIFEDEISVKGGHTLGYKEAGRDGYKKVSKDITKMLKENIQL